MQVSRLAWCMRWRVALFFFFQAEDGIRDLTVTGVQTCALPIFPRPRAGEEGGSWRGEEAGRAQDRSKDGGQGAGDKDRKSTRLNSSHSQISYAVFCLKKKKQAAPHVRPSILVLSLTKGLEQRTP